MEAFGQIRREVSLGRFELSAFGVERFREPNRFAQKTFRSARSATGNSELAFGILTRMASDVREPPKRKYQKQILESNFNIQSAGRASGRLKLNGRLESVQAWVRNFSKLFEVCRRVRIGLWQILIEDYRAFLLNTAANPAERT